MDNFLTKIKNSSNSSKFTSFLLLNIFQIQIIVSMFIGVNWQLFSAFEFIYGKNEQNLQKIGLRVLTGQTLFLLLIVVLLAFQQKIPIRFYRIIGELIKYYKKIFTVPILFICFLPFGSTFTPSLIAISTINFTIVVFVSYLYERQCLSYRFRIRNNFLRKFSPNWLDFSLIVSLAAVSCLSNAGYGGIVLIFRNTLSLRKLCTEYEQPQIQKIKIFYALYQAMISTIIIVDVFTSYDLGIYSSLLIFILVSSGIVIMNVSSSFSIYVYNRFLSRSILLSVNDEQQDQTTNQQRVIKKYLNYIRVLSMIYIQRQKYDKKQINQFDKWWHVFNRKVIVHKLQCSNIKCKCLLSKSQFSTKIYLKNLAHDIKQLETQFNKYPKIKIMSIYMYIQLCQKPLKAYYQLMKIKSLKMIDDAFELEELTFQVRQSFDQLFLKHQVKNQKLQLLKVIEFEEKTHKCEEQLKKIITETIQFYSFFNFSSVKLQKLKYQSNLLKNLKQQFSSDIQNLIHNFSSNNKLNVLIYVFYNYIDVYNQNKEIQLKKIDTSRMLQKRMFQKKEVNIFNPEYGTILIDLVQQRGKIRNVTKNMCTSYGYAKEDMINFNINLFMPRLFGKHHAKFLNNFIEYGKIKLLTQTNREVFGKNKKKFIFPLKITLKAQYLQDNFFGSSALLQPMQSSSEFIIVDKSGKVQEMTEGLFKKVFSLAFYQQNTKISRLHINKLIPTFNLLFESSFVQGSNFYNKIIEGSLIYCNDTNYFLDKFKFTRELNRINRSATSKSQTSYSLNISSTYSFAGDQQNSTQPLTKQEEVKNLVDVLKYFLSEIDLWVLSALKISFKVTPINTAEFQAYLIEIVNINSFPSEEVLYQTVLDQFRMLVDIFKLNDDDHSSIFTHFASLQAQVDARQFPSLNSNNSNTVNSSHHSAANQLVGKEAPRQKIRSVYTVTQSMKPTDHEPLLQLLDDSTANTDATDNLEGLSRRQILINSFSDDDKKILDSRLVKTVHLSIFVIFCCLTIMLVMSGIYINLIEQEWKSISYLERVKQLFLYRKALLEMKQFEISQKVNVSEFVQEKSSQLNEVFKMKVKNIYESAVEQKYFGQIYTDVSSIPITEIQTGASSFIFLLKRLLYSFIYPDKMDYTRQYYKELRQQFDNLEDRAHNFLMNKKNQLVSGIFGVVGVCFLLIILNKIGYAVVQRVSHQEEIKFGQLLSYISYNELKKSLHRLNIIKSQLTQIQKPQFMKQLKLKIKTETPLTQSPSSQQQKGVQIIPQQVSSGNSSHWKDVIFIVTLIFLLSAFPIYSNIKVKNISDEFDEIILVNKALYEMENKPAQLLNGYLVKVNAMSSSLNTTLEYPIMTHNYFHAQHTISMSPESDLPIMQTLFKLLKSPICELTPCTIRSSRDLNNDNITLDYLIYSFRQKFTIFSSASSMSSAQLNQWIQDNKILDLLMWIEQIINAGTEIDSVISDQYSRELNNQLIQMIVVGVLLIVLSGLVLQVIQYRLFNHLNNTLNQSQDIFRHFDLETLAENTYLTSYFTAKLKQNK